MATSDPCSQNQSIEDAIETSAIRGVKKAKEEDREKEMMPLSEMIEADRYLAGKKAAVKPHFGLRFTRMRPPAGGS